jgi:hypothetical protein
VSDGGEVATHHGHIIDISCVSFGYLMWVFGGFSFSGYECSPFLDSEQLARKKSASLPVRMGWVN